MDRKVQRALFLWWLWQGIGAYPSSVAGSKEEHWAGSQETQVPAHQGRARVPVLTIRNLCSKPQTSLTQASPCGLGLLSPGRPARGRRCFLAPGKGKKSERGLPRGPWWRRAWMDTANRFLLNLGPTGPFDYVLLWRAHPAQKCPQRPGVWFMVLSPMPRTVPGTQ